MNHSKSDKSPAHADTAAVDRPIPAGVNAPTFGSDVVADAIGALDIPYIALNPGASYRGLHDSIVNYLGNEQPQMLLCLHEESAIAIAHGYAKVTGKAMAAAVHSNVGLMHATMSIFNAWCDRMPMLIIGATGPNDADKRRPWIEWIHTARDQGALVRNYTKWDDQPGSPIAARESVFRAAWIANTAPCGPTYVNLDVEVQEQKLTKEVPAVADAKRYMPTVTSGPDAAAIKATVALLKGAKNIVVMAGRVSRSVDAWNTRIAFVERLGAKVITQLKVSAAFPTDHPLHIGAPGVISLAAESAKALEEADVILSLDWLDVAGTFKGAPGITAKVIQISVDHRLHNGWSMDYQGLPTVDLMIDCEPDAAVPVLLEALGPGKGETYARTTPVFPALSGTKVTVNHMADALRRAVGDRPVSLTHLPLSWNGASWPLRHPLDYLGSDGGGGIGGGPGISIGAALALKGTGRLPVAVCGDGDFLMGVTALWTAVHYKIPVLFVLSNNRSFFNDELHQERVARMRTRPVENRWIGQRISEPDIDLASMARAQGAEGFTVNTLAEMDGILAQAVAAVEAGGVVVVDVRVEVGYADSAPTAPTGKNG